MNVLNLPGSYARCQEMLGAKAPRTARHTQLMTTETLTLHRTPAAKYKNYMNPNDSLARPRGTLVITTCWIPQKHPNTYVLDKT